MREMRASEAKVVADENRARILTVLAAIRALRQEAKPMSINEILAARSESQPGSGKPLDDQPKRVPS